METLVWAIKNGDLEQVKEKLEDQITKINENVDGRNLIHYAADYGQAQVLEYLISKSADVNVKDKHGITPLLAAIWEGHTECVEILLRGGAEKKGTAPDGTTYLEAAEKEDIKALIS